MLVASMRRLLLRLAQFGGGFRFRSLLLFVGLCAPLFILTLYTATADRRRALDNFSQCAPKIAHIASREEQAVMTQPRQLLLAMADTSPVCSVNPQHAQLMAPRFLAAFPHYANFGVID